MAAWLAVRFASWWPKAPAFFWALVMAGLPLTSFPLITHFTGSTVAPFSAIPLAILALIWFIPTLLRRGSLPRESVPFVFFVLWVIVLAALAFFNVTGMFRDKPLLNQTINSLLSFIIGVAFFFITAAWNQDAARLRRSLLWIHAGGVIMLVFAVAQVLVIVLLNGKYPRIMQTITHLLVTQSSIEGTGRIAGLTWEASWFAHQLNMLYLPLWLAASYQRTTVFPRIWKISLENIFLVAGLVAFFFTSPRIGAAACMMMMLYLFFKLNLAVYRWIIRRLSRLWSAVQHSRLLQAGIGTLVVVVFVGAYAVFSWGVLKVFSEHDWRVALLVKSPLSQSDIQQLSKLNENSLFFVSQRFAFLERSVYWMTGWHIFNDYPLAGVGLGNAGYYYVDRLPAIGWATYEVRTLMYRDDGLPNIKSMWYRLLAETGIVGFMLFITWLLVLWFSLSASQRSRDKTLRTAALAGQLALLAFVFEGFSIDSFGLPYLFVITGLSAAVGLIYRRQLTAG
jgi:hypothetical protein